MEPAPRLDAAAVIATPGVATIVIGGTVSAGSELFTSSDGGQTWSGGLPPSAATFADLALTPPTLTPAARRPRLHAPDPGHRDPDRSGRNEPDADEPRRRQDVDADRVLRSPVVRLALVVLSAASVAGCGGSGSTGGVAGSPSPS